MRRKGQAREDVSYMGVSRGRVMSNEEGFRVEIEKHKKLPEDETLEQTKP